MKTIGKGVWILIAVVALLVIVGIGSYNGLATSREAVSSAESQIDTALQRRADLIPNVVASVQSFASHETEIINAVTEARAQLANAGTLEEKAAADQAMTTALTNLNVIVENYPELKSDTVYIGLMDELAGSENRISVARQDYNDTVRAYNNRIIRFPASLLAGIFGFAKAPYFEASAGAEVVPDVAGMLGN